jgi:hypothetical protein
VFQTIYAGSVAWCPAFSFYLISGLAAGGLLVSFALPADVDSKDQNNGRGDEETRPLLDASVQALD